MFYRGFFPVPFNDKNNRVRHALFYAQGARESGVRIRREAGVGSLTTDDGVLQVECGNALRGPACVTFPVRVSLWAYQCLS